MTEDPRSSDRGCETARNLPSLTLSAFSNNFERTKFHALLEKWGFLLTFTHSNWYKKNPTVIQRYLRNANILHTEPVLKKIGDFLETLGDLDIENLTFRMVIADERNTTDSMLDAAKTHGGMNPNDPTLGICMDNGRKIQEYVNNPLNRGNSIVVFIYDKTKLERLSAEEKQTDVLFRADYAMKPKEGQSFREALLGTIVLENRQDGWQREYDRYIAGLCDDTKTAIQNTQQGPFLESPLNQSTD